MAAYIILLTLIIITFVLYKINKPKPKCNDCGNCQKNKNEMRDKK